MQPTSAKFLFFSLEGRISRIWWWIGTVILLIPEFLLPILGFWLIGEDPTYFWNDKPSTPHIALVEVISYVVLIRLYFAVDIKRIHDRGRTAYLLVPLYLGWLMVITLEGFGYDWLFFTVLSEGWNFSDYMGQTLFTALTVFLIVYSLWLLFELGIRKGTNGPSKYGPDPLEAVTKPTDETI